MANAKKREKRVAVAPDEGEVALDGSLHAVKLAARCRRPALRKGSAWAERPHCVLAAGP
jgi:hypothetical protein